MKIKIDMDDQESSDATDPPEIDLNLIDLAKICSLSYKIKNDTIYNPEESEKSLFEKISNSILSIDCYLENIQAISCITKDEKILIISVAGSNDVQDFLYNLDAIQISPYDENRNFISKEIRFHKGFYIQFIDMLENLRPILSDFKSKGKMIIMCGHSMGGCLASIGTFYLKNLDICRNIQVVTFGAPVFTNSLGANWFEQNLKYTRVELDKDPIPKLPIDVRYWHVYKTHIYIKNGKILLNADSAQEGCLDFIKKLFKKKLDLKYHDIYEYINQINL